MNESKIKNFYSKLAQRLNLTEDHSISLLNCGKRKKIQRFKEAMRNEKNQLNIQTYEQNINKLEKSIYYQNNIVQNNNLYNFNIEQSQGPEPRGIYFSNIIDNENSYSWIQWNLDENGGQDINPNICDGVIVAKIDQNKLKNLKNKEDFVTFCNKYGKNIDWSEVAEQYKGLKTTSIGPDFSQLGCLYTFDDINHEVVWNSDAFCNKKNYTKIFFVILFCLIIPSALSYFIYDSFEEDKNYYYKYGFLGGTVLSIIIGIFVGIFVKAKKDVVYYPTDSSLIQNLITECDLRN